MSTERKITIIQPTEFHEHEIRTRRRKVVAYCRVSTNMESQQTSYNAQREYYRELIQSKPEWDFMGIYADEGISGRSMKKRVEFRRMVADGMAGKFDLIMVKSVSRFARNVVDCLSVVKELKEHGVEIYFEKENLSSFSNDKITNFQLTIYSTIAQEESEGLSDSVNWGIKRRNEKGIVKANKVYGYDIGPNKEFIINPEEAKVVKLIFESYLAGEGIYGICHILERRKIPSPKGNPYWSDSTINKILTNEKYIGDVLLQKTITLPYKRTRRPRSGDNNQYYIENHHDPIISKDMFEKVKREREFRKNQRGYTSTGKSVYTAQYPFSSKLYCYECGSKFRRHAYKKKDGTNVVTWVCVNHKLHSDQCHQKQVKEKSLEDAFTKIMKEVLANGDQLIETALNNLSTVIDGNVNTDRLEELDTEIAGLQSEINRLMNDKEYSSKIDIIQTKTMDIMEQIVKLNKEREDLQIRITSYEHNIERVAKLKESLSKEKLLDEFNPMVFRMLVEKVIIDGKEATFIFNDELKVTAQLD